MEARHPHKELMGPRAHRLMSPWARGLTGPWPQSLSKMCEGKVIAQQRWPVKVSAQQTGMIEQRLKDKINADVASQLYRLLTSTQISVDP